VREPSRVLGQLLLAEGGIDDKQLASALSEQRITRERIGEILIRSGVNAEHVARALAHQLKLPYVTPPLLPEQNALALIDRNAAHRMRVLPLSLRDKAVQVAMADPLDIAAIDDLQFRTGRRVEPAVSTPRAVEQGLLAYDAKDVATLLARIPSPANSSTEDELRRASEAPPVVALLDHILAKASATRASDVHIEPLPDRLLVRARVDGVLRELVTLPLHVAGALTSRVKVTAGMDISVRRKPQDGRCSFRAAGCEIAARVSTLPSHHGEKIVLRLLSSHAAVQSLDAIGMQQAMLAEMRALLKRAHGVLLVTGPTGSGKTSTLYAALAEMDAQRKNIVTLEDPIERKLEGVTQVQVNRRGGVTFSRALRAVLRQDPDVILVGELRDRETVETAFAAALTGHLVLSTLHTNDAPSAATRLVEMGAPPYLICGALIGVLAQRLVRRICPHCGGARCNQCDATGYLGRIGVFELMKMNPAVRDAIMKRAPADVIRETVRASGCSLLPDDARAKVNAGVTTSDEAAALLALD
jgi:type IV pilus assembly protein PilB